jgi:hypothetical protein
VSHFVFDLKNKYTPHHIIFIGTRNPAFWVGAVLAKRKR